MCTWKWKLRSRSILSRAISIVAIREILLTTTHGPPSRVLVEVDRGFLDPRASACSGR